MEVGTEKCQLSRVYPKLTAYVIVVNNGIKDNKSYKSLFGY